MTPRDNIPNITANPETQVSDSCNCCDNCSITCCFPWRGRRIRRHPNNQAANYNACKGHYIYQDHIKKLSEDN